MVNKHDNCTADEKAPDLTIVTPESWALAYYSDDDGYVIEITNTKYKRMKMNPDSYVVLEHMMAGIALFMKNYAVLEND